MRLVSHTLVAVIIVGFTSYFCLLFLQCRGNTQEVKKEEARKQSSGVRIGSTDSKQREQEGS